MAALALYPGSNETAESADHASEFLDEDRMKDKISVKASMTESGTASPSGPESFLKLVLVVCCGLLNRSR